MIKLKIFPFNMAHTQLPTVELQKKVKMKEHVCKSSAAQEWLI